MSDISPTPKEIAKSPEYSLSGLREGQGGVMEIAQLRISDQLGDFDVESAIRSYDKLREFTRLIIMRAFSTLKESDFVRFSSVSGNDDDDGKPWLTVYAAERVAAMVGISYGFLDNAGPVTETGVDGEGAWWLRRAHMRFTFGGQTIEAQGEAWSRDGLLSGGGKLNAAQVPRTKIDQKAISRTVQNGVCRILGFRGMTWDDVRELMGEKPFDIKKVRAAKFEQGGKGGSLSAGKPEDVAQKSQVWKIYDAWCKAVGRTSARDNWFSNLSDWTAFIGQVTDKPRKEWTEYKIGELRNADKLIKDLQNSPT